VSSKINGSRSGDANTNGENTDFDKRFGTDADQTRLRTEVLWRITPRQHLRFSYFNNAVQGTRAIDQDLAWGDYTFLAGGQVTAEVKFRVYELNSMSSHFCAGRTTKSWPSWACTSTI
jgi:hypothetical protein